jgi:hypothetical protein
MQVCQYHKNMRCVHDHKNKHTFFFSLKRDIGLDMAPYSLVSHHVIFNNEGFYIKTQIK